MNWLLWYNQERLHSTLHYVSPMRYEQNWQMQQPSILNPGAGLRDTFLGGKDNSTSGP